jgi:small subunit ribosomal protein S35
VCAATEGEGLTRAPELAKPFQPPVDGEVLRFRYTTYMGEFHPADRKVVVEFSPVDLADLTPAQQLKLKKLAGSRYNPEKDTIKMSCERFEHQAQNKRYLGDLVDKMIATAKVGNLATTATPHSRVPC